MFNFQLLETQQLSKNGKIFLVLCSTGLDGSGNILIISIKLGNINTVGLQLNVSGATGLEIFVMPLHLCLIRMLD